MNENEWLTATSPNEMVYYLRTKLRINQNKVGRRKLRLFGCACCRRNWKLFKNYLDCIAVIAAAERFADGDISASVLERLDQRLQPLPVYSKAQSIILAARAVASTNAIGVATGAAQYCAQAKAFADRDHRRAIMSEQAQAAILFRCIFGNPFRPVAFDPVWRTSDVVALARGIYDDRAFDRMPILADALQDAGCDNDDILNHCRDTNTPHARGCWVVDLVLEKQ